MTNIFIDGSAGTTGLRIYERLSKRNDINLITLSEELRKDISARKDALNSADIAFLCLPDAAAIEAVSLLDNNKTAIIDTSTAHRVDPDWTYGFPELCGGKNYENIASSKRIANPGCHASGFTALVEPLTASGILDKSAKLSCVSLTGYSGGGKKMIAEYESPERDALYNAPRMYGLTQQHKHLKEMKAVCGLENAPAFCPIVAPFYSGMEVTVTLFADQIKGNLADISALYAEYYKKGLVKFVTDADESGFLSSGKYSGRDDMEISVYGNDERVILVSRFDNLGKGASGAAIQNMNILLGVDEATGLDV
ncbi:MAG: N-acetyl-gamma-glutamyl-phosphate reductase [Clostridia bacterium]|nr:N-acetyl-gamma-glutamyl-phosphate reductase [Clostridia bacterium]